METIQETAADQYPIVDGSRKKPADPVQSKNVSGAAIKKMQEIAQGIYDSTPCIGEEIPRQTSKILQNAKKDKKLPGLYVGKMTTFEMNFEDLQSKYENILKEYQAAKNETVDLQSRLVEKQDRYIAREQEYKDVISDLQTKIRDNSTRPLDIIEP